jgi:adenosylcobinamide-GDP ribazoletransferase
MIHDLVTAINFLTILPIPSRKPSGPHDLGRAAAWFPLVGALIGIITAAAYWGLSRIFPRSLVSVLSALVWIVLTGGLHLDGLADCCDGLLVSADRDRRLEIMKDPHHGTYAGIGLTFAILLKVSALYSLQAANIWLVLPFAAALSRWMLLPAGLQPSARQNGLGHAFSSGLNWQSILLGTLPVAGLAFFIGWRAALAALAVFGLTLLVIRLARKRLGGISGDVFGLIVELGEIMVLIFFCVKESPLWI